MTILRNDEDAAAQGVVFLQSPALAALPGLRHGFFTRRGGVSGGLYDSLNCGPGSRDAPENVAENRRRAVAALGLGPTARTQEPSALASLYQVHGAEVATLSDPPPAAERPKADGMVTARPGLALGILTADCVPVLFAAPRARLVGACHAGWKGALFGILEATIDRLESLGAARRQVICAIGPAIRQPSYEVGPEFPAPFLAADAANGKFFIPAPRDGHWLFDLPGFVASRLRAAGVGTVDDLGRDTRTAAADFFSYRRTTLAGEPDYGRQLSAIALAP